MMQVVCALGTERNHIKQLRNKERKTEKDSDRKQVRKERKRKDRKRKEAGKIERKSRAVKKEKGNVARKKRRKQKQRKKWEKSWSSRFVCCVHQIN